ncbi:CelD/BcsL family acetyltransferase involved in cellulose biosynthesis [Sphingomonas sp. PP-F2F-A104-K0414]|uniref:GNAT family N-acetyltransferase n=1 Tax=Sphingomonas sp. PP-F2F-A104-K0414 TaxID=2135661 RepID=UPI001043791A|nr:GNAT family N-acetyltransferase [Sphingomonas sp. PP-F2F-A104-K0414]TCP99356.1 CelD/BcsL family acetyltransferase involved in cellulose biosynthesis [Sphingomonas sp. PP-F2F-A104-K0414]
MSKPMLLADFVRLPPTVRADVVEGLAAAIDSVAERGAESHRFLRFGWYAAALAAYGGQAKTLVVEQDDVPVLTLPFVPLGPGLLRIAAIPGCYWPFRSFGLALEAGEPALKAALSTLARNVNGIRIGPVYDTDPAAAALIATARGQGWTTVDRAIGDSWSLDLPRAREGEPWPRTSTLRKNRFHEKHLAEHGAPDWRFLSGADWPAAFADLGAVEQTSWIAHATDRTGMKFTADGHLAFWQAAVADPVLAGMFRAALLTVDGAPAAFSFDIDTGELLYAVANSYDPRFAKHSPGKLLYWRNLVAAQARGIRRVDWGAGDSGYKQVIGATVDAPIRDWLLFRPGLPALAGRLLGWLWRRSGQSRG